MKYEHLWERLLEFLNGWSTASEVEPGRVEVVLEDQHGSTRVIKILMTPDQWDQMVSVMWGGFGPEIQQHVKERVLRLQARERFLLYGDYDLIPSETEGLPQETELARLSELARQHPEGIGRLVALDREGKVEDEFRE